MIFQAMFTGFVFVGVDNRSLFKDLQDKHSHSPGVPEIFYLSLKGEDLFTENAGTFSLMP